MPRRGARRAAARRRRRQQQHRQQQTRQRRQNRQQRARDRRDRQRTRWRNFLARSRGRWRTRHTTSGSSSYTGTTIDLSSCCSSSDGVKRSPQCICLIIFGLISLLIGGVLVITLNFQYRYVVAAASACAALFCFAWAFRDYRRASLAQLVEYHSSGATIDIQVNSLPDDPDPTVSNNPEAADSTQVDMNFDGAPPSYDEIAESDQQEQPPDGSTPAEPSISVTPTAPDPPPPAYDSVIADTTLHI